MHFFFLYIKAPFAMFGVNASESILAGVLVYIYEAIVARKFWNKAGLISGVEAGLSLAIANWLTTWSASNSWMNTQNQMFWISSFVSGLIYGAMRKVFNSSNNDGATKIVSDLTNALPGELVYSASGNESYWKNVGYMFIFAIISKSISRPVWRQLNITFNLDANVNVPNSTVGSGSPSGLLPATGQYSAGDMLGSVPGASLNFGKVWSGQPVLQGPCVC